MAIKNKTITVDQIDQLLPQTQCGLCDYAGCRPYAEAIAHNEAPIDRCPPGGVNTLIQLGSLVDQDPSAFIAEMKEKEKPPLIAIIREDECIGCTKCIQACPTDAILGAGKRMHTVITDACTGCELCVEPCPVDCIDMEIIPECDAAQKKQHQNDWRDRYQHRNARLHRNTLERQQKHAHAKLNETPQPTRAARQAAIAAAVARAKAKRKMREGTP